MNRRDLILGVIAAVLIIAAIGYYSSRPSVTAELPQEIKLNAACLACRQHVQMVAGLRDPKPYECPECSERAVYPLLLCRDCGKHFVPNLERREESEFPKMPMMPSCPSCGSVNVGSYLGTETIPADELVLPAWPQ
jgi:DNA-directed RNA polymerase subunit RPC12/RpoP